MTNYTWENCRVLKKRKRNQLACACRKSLHHLPDALCQQVRALIDLRLPNCTLIKERSCSAPFFLLILTLFIWLWRGHSWAQCVGALCEGLVRSQEFIFLPTRPFHSTARSERWLRSGESTVCHTEFQHVADRRQETRQRGGQHL